MARGEFRRDLFYRLNAHARLHCRRCATRLQDIPLLVQSFIERYGEQDGRRVDGHLASRPWKCCSPIPGRATCGNCATSSSMPASWPAATASSRAICPLCAKPPVCPSPPWQLAAKPWRKSNASSFWTRCANWAATAPRPPCAWASPCGPCRTSSNDTGGICLIRLTRDCR